MKFLVKVAICNPVMLWRHIQIKSPFNSFAYEKQVRQDENNTLAKKSLKSAITTY